MKCKLYWFEIPAQSLPALQKIDWGMALLEKLGSNPRHAGETVEGLRVPDGKVWLFPSNDRKLAQFLTENEVRHEYHERYVTI